MFLEDYNNTKDPKYPFVIGIAIYSLESWINECYYDRIIPDKELKEIDEKLSEVIKDIKKVFNVRRNGAKDYMSVNVWTPKGYIADITKNNNVIIKRK